MKRACLHILTAVLTILCLSSCAEKTKVIPRSDMVDIYVDLFLADQWLLGDPGQMRVADTTMFYEPIFRSHGYTTEDYITSVNHYLGDPKRYARLLRKADDRLLAKAGELSKIVDEEEMLRQQESIIRTFDPDLKLYYDTLYMRITRQAGLVFKADEMGRYMPVLPEPEPAVDTVAAVADTVIAE